MFRRTLLVTLAVAAIAADAPPSGDLLDQARRMNQVAVLQVEADAKLALRERFVEPRLQEPIKDPARLDWHEVSKVSHYYLTVDAMQRPMQVREESPGSTRHRQ